MRTNTTQPKSIIEPLEGRALFSTAIDAEPAGLAPTATEPAVVVSKTSLSDTSSKAGTGAANGIIAILIGL